MRVLLDCRSAMPAPGGIGRVSAALARYLCAALRPGEELELLTCPGVPEGLGSDRAQEVEVESCMIDPTFEQVLLPGLLAEREIDVYHGTCFATPIAAGGAARVATVHDVVFRRHPELVEPRLREYLDRWTRVSCQVAEAIVTVSEFSRREIAACYGRPAGRIDVVPNGIDERFGRIARRSAPGRPYLLYVGALEPKKNLAALLAAYGALLRREPSLPHVLVLVGGSGGAPFDLEAAVRAVPGIAPRVHALGKVPDEALLELLGAADLFVYPSEYEGFGLPPLEAMAAGVPTIVSDRGALPEVVAEGALVTDPHDPEGFARAMSGLLFDAGAREALAVRGRLRAAELSWARAAEALLGVYRRVHAARVAAEPAPSPEAREELHGAPIFRVLAGGGAR